MNTAQSALGCGSKAWRLEIICARGVVSCLSLVLPLLLVVSCKSAAPSTESNAQVVSTKKDLEQAKGKRIIVEGTYHDPGKGNRCLLGQFGVLNIEDYSLLRKTAEGYLVCDLQEGQRIQVEADLRYFPGGLERVEDHIRKQERLEPPQTINGKSYYVHKPSYSISKAILISK